MSRRWMRIAVVAVLIVNAAAGWVLAHESQEIGTWNVTFGMMPEPVFTDQFYKTTWRFVDEAGNPVLGLENLTVTIVKDGAPYGPFAVSAAHGSPGLYETPTIFADAGEYRFILNGSSSDPEVGGPFSVEFHKEILDAAIITVGS